MSSAWDGHGEDVLLTLFEHTSEDHCHPIVQMVRVVEQTMRTLADVIDEVSLGIEREGQLFIREGAANTDVARDALRRVRGPLALWL